MDGEELLDPLLVEDLDGLGVIEVEGEATQIRSVFVDPLTTLSGNRRLLLVVVIVPLTDIPLHGWGLVCLVYA